MINQVVISAGVVIFVSVSALIYQMFNRTKERSIEYHRNFNETSKHVTNCFICMEEFTNFNTKQDIFILECKHKFHRECIRLLLSEGRNQKTCPMCRKIISESDSKKLELSSE